MRLLLVALLTTSAACGRIPAAADAVAAHTVIIDTDAGIDDLMAIAWLLTIPDVEIEAITIGTGLANIGPGASNVLRLLALAGRDDIPVFTGSVTPVAGDRAFPAEWRALTDSLPGVDLPRATRTPEERPASDFLAERFGAATRPVEILALGGLTNIAEALARSGSGAPGLRRLVIMGGAVGVAGNLHEAGPNENTTAEWNFYIDAEAARQVFASGLPILLIPLDATDDVPLDRSYIDQLRAAPGAPLAHAVAQIMEIVAPFMDVGNYYAWDPLAAVALVDPTIVTTRPAAIAILLEPPQDGRSVEQAGQSANALVAVAADAHRFRSDFVKGLAAERQR
jgi:pyrimidine-specific ribonucleoside hydrolase